MPIVQRSNTRVLPPNARSADVARATINAAIPIQNRKTDAAFQVNGYTGVLYSYLVTGTKCACQSKKQSVVTRLDEGGHASQTDINAMLTGNGNFGVRPYADKQPETVAYVTQRSQGKSILEVNLAGHLDRPVPLSSLFDDEDVASNDRFTSGLPDRIDLTGGNIHGTLEIASDPNLSVHSLLTDFDTSLLGHSDVSCPICFGSGYIGGFDILHGYRRVLNFQHPNIVLPAVAVIGAELDIPNITTSIVSWPVSFPAGCSSVDAFRLWNDTKQVFGFKTTVDGETVLTQQGLAKYCDGKEHVVELTFPDQEVFTHLEIQINQSDFSANFELPKLAKGSTQSLREVTDPFTVFLSPRVPYIKSLDVIVESTFGKALQVKTVTGLNDKRYSTMGWEVDVRPTQPQELFSMLPRRRPLETINTRAMRISTKQTT